MSPVTLDRLSDFAPQLRRMLTTIPVDQIRVRVDGLRPSRRRGISPTWKPSWICGDSNLHAATREQRERQATQEGVAGPVTLARIADMMSEHDASHAAEIARVARA